MKIKNIKKIREVLSSFKVYLEALDTGKIISVKDGVARVNGIFGVLPGEMVHLGISKLEGMVLSLEHNTVSVVIFGNDTLLKQVDLVYRTFVIMHIPLSIKLFGRVVDALGNTIDAGPKVTSALKRKVDTKAVGIIPRQSVREPMQTGVNSLVKGTRYLGVLKRSYTSSSRSEICDEIANIIEFCPGSYITWVEMNAVLKEFEIKIGNKKLSLIIKRMGGTRKTLPIEGKRRRVIYDIQFVLKGTIKKSLVSSEISKEICIEAEEAEEDLSDSPFKNSVDTSMHYNYDKYDFNVFRCEDGYYRSPHLQKGLTKGYGNYIPYEPSSDEEEPYDVPYEPSSDEDHPPSDEEQYDVPYDEANDTDTDTDTGVFD